MVSPTWDSWGKWGHRPHCTPSYCTGPPASVCDMKKTALDACICDGLVKFNSEIDFFGKIILVWYKGLHRLTNFW